MRDRQGHQQRREHETILRHYDCTFFGNLFCIFTGAGDNRISNSNAHEPLSSGQSYNDAEPVSGDIAQIAASSRPAASFSSLGSDGLQGDRVQGDQLQGDRLQGL